jgi:hypothetical protein
VCEHSFFASFVFHTLSLSCHAANVFIIIFFNSFCNLLWRRVHADFASENRYNFYFAVRRFASSRRGLSSSPLRLASLEKGGEKEKVRKQEGKSEFRFH